MLRVHKADQLHSSVSRTILFAVLTWFLTHTPLPLLKFILLTIDVTTFWVRLIINKLKNSKERVLLSNLSQSTSFLEYIRTAFELDKLLHNDIWKENLVSGKYDYRLIQERLHDLQSARLTNDTPKVLSLLRAGMLRNFGGISSKRLYNRTYTGTKILIEQYNHELTNCLKWLNDSPWIDSQAKLDFFHDAKTTLGATALCLHGGSLFGLCHLGVVKGLLDGDLLPDVIVGSGAGSAVGALLCCLQKHELDDIFNDVGKCMNEDGLGFDDMWAAESDKGANGEYNNIKLLEDLKKGMTMELKNFIQFTLNRIGNVTFKEAYQKSGKAFNILVYPSSNKMPTLLNYLSTPYITVKSAVYCSIGTGVFEVDKEKEAERNNNEYIDPYQLMIKYNGILAKYSNVDCDFRPPYQVGGESMELKNSPYDRITELFNVNHFIISISRPYLAPFLTGDWRSTYQRNTIMKKLLNILNIEFKHRIRMLNRFGLLSSLMRWLLVDEKSMLLDSNYIPIVPVGNKWILWDLLDLFIQNKSVLNYWIECGERSVWAMHSLLETRISTEVELDEYYEKYRKIH